VLADRLTHQIPIELIERATDVEFDTPVVFPASLPGYSHRIRGRLFGPIPVRVWMKEPFQLSFDPRFDNLLGDSISDSGDS
jgi:hypothetical protein